MFKLQPNPTHFVRVALTVVGESAPGAIELEFKHLGLKARQAFFKGLEGKTDAEALAEVIVGWKGVDAAFSPENLQALLDHYPLASVEIFNAWREQALEARVKN